MASYGLDGLFVRVECVFPQRMVIGAELGGSEARVVEAGAMGCRYRLVMDGRKDRALILCSNGRSDEETVEGLRGKDVVAGARAGQSRSWAAGTFAISRKPTWMHV